jgi:hypothetical protein
MLANGNQLLLFFKNGTYDSLYTVKSVANQKLKRTLIRRHNQAGLLNDRTVLNSHIAYIVNDHVHSILSKMKFKNSLTKILSNW